MLRHDKAITHPIRQKEHLKNVPDYLMPASMRGFTTMRQKGNKKKRKLRNVNNNGVGVGASQEQRVLRSKMKNPLFNQQQVSSNQQSSLLGDVNSDHVHNDTHDNDDRNNVQPLKSTNEKLYANSSVLGESKLSGRREWKLKHKKGDFNPKIMKRNTHRMTGSFIKSKNYK